MSFAPLSGHFISYTTNVGGPWTAPAETHSAYKVRGQLEARTRPSFLFARRPSTGHPQDSLAGGTPAHKAGPEKQGSLCRGFNILPVLIAFPEMETWVEMICSSPDFSECVCVRTFGFIFSRRGSFLAKKALLK